VIYLVLKIVLWLVLAFVLGLGLGWWLRQVKAQQARADFDRQLGLVNANNTELADNIAQQNRSLAELEVVLADKDQAFVRQADDLRQAQQRQVEAEQGNAEQEAELTQLSGEILLLQSAATELAAKHEASSVEHALANRLLKDRLSVADTDLMAATREASHWQQQVVSLQEQSTTAAQQADEEINALRIKMSDAEQQRQQVEVAQAQQRQQLNRLQSSNGQLQTTLVDLQAQVKSATEAEQKTRLQAEQQRAELSAKQTALDDAQGQLQRLTADVRRWRQRIPDLQSELDEREAQVRERDARVSSLQEQLSLRSARLTQAQHALTLAGSNKLGDRQKDARIAALTAQLAQPGVNTEAGVAKIAALQAMPPPPSFYSQAPEQIDDLQQIKGIGPKLETLLQDYGVYQFQQIAQFSPAEVAWLDERLNFKGRISRDDWIEQARRLI